MEEGEREGSSGTCIKDTWTKPKGGRIEGESEDGCCGEASWGENGDNCT